MNSTKTVIITGASSGIGLALAKAFLASGARVVANSRNLTKAGTLTPGPNLVLVDGDIASPEVADRIVEAAERFGGADLLVNNAGVFIAKPFTDYTAEDFAGLVSTNLTGFLHVTQRAVRRMRARGTGHVVTITTALADQPIAGVTASIPILTKAGLNAASKALAIEHAAEGIRFNTVAPGMVDTPMHKPGNAFHAEATPPDRANRIDRGDRRCGHVPRSRDVRHRRSAARGRRRARGKVVRPMARY